MRYEKGSIDKTTNEYTYYSWDIRDRLTGIRVINALGEVIRTANYVYDVYDQRIAKIVDPDGDGVQAATTERFVYGSNQNIALVFDESGNLTNRYMFGNSIDQIESDEQLAIGTTLWALTDHLGSVRDVVDNSGTLQNHIVYDAFGNITSQSNSSVIFRNSYTGQEFDSESGQYYYGGRYYDPYNGKFIQEDKIGFAGGDTNLSRYVFNSPTNLVDPIGNQAIRFLAPSIRQFPTNQFGVPDSRFNIDKNLIEIEDTLGKAKRGLLDFLTPPAGDPNEATRINQLKGVPLPRPGELAPDKPKSPIGDDETKAGKKPKRNEDTDRKRKRIPNPFEEQEPNRFPYQQPICSEDEKDKKRKSIRIEVQMGSGKTGEDYGIPFQTYAKVGVTVIEAQNLINEFDANVKAKVTDSQWFPLKDFKDQFNDGIISARRQVYEARRNGGFIGDNVAISSVQWDKNGKYVNKGLYRVELVNKLGRNLSS